jgi:hypothetical protein
LRMCWKKAGNALPTGTACMSHEDRGCVATNDYVFMMILQGSAHCRYKGSKCI